MSAITFFIQPCQGGSPCRDQGRQVAKVAALVAGGAVIGAGIGLLFAPQTGAETRRDVGRYAKKAQLQATRWSRTVQSGVKEVWIAVSLSSARTMRAADRSGVVGSTRSAVRPEAQTLCGQAVCACL